MDDFKEKGVEVIAEFYKRYHNTDDRLGFLDKNELCKCLNQCFEEFKDDTQNLKYILKKFNRELLYHHDPTTEREILAEAFESTLTTLTSLTALGCCLYKSHFNTIKR